LVARIPILYEDDHMLVVDKPPRMLVVPAPGRSGPTVVSEVGRQLGARVYAVHRLDEDTTGVLVLAKTPDARESLEGVFMEHRAERIYLALVGRMPSPPAGRVESRLRESPGGIVESVARGPGQRAVTNYKVLRRVGREVLVECRPETGRRNQIRVHLADLGCPVVGDRKYGYRGRGGSSAKLPLLHAWRITLPHPVEDREVVVEAETPEAFPRG